MADQDDAQCDDDDAKEDMGAIFGPDFGGAPFEPEREGVGLKLVASFGFHEGREVSRGGWARQTRWEKSERKREDVKREASKCFWSLQTVTCFRDSTFHGQET